MRDVRDENRDATIVALYKGGATMQEIADISGGISRERVRQLLQRNGISGEYNGERIDPIRVVAICRRQGVFKWSQVAHQMGLRCSGHALRSLVEPLGMGPAIDRLFSSRYRKERQQFRARRRAELAGTYKALAERLGRVPTITELNPRNGVSFWAYFFKYFDSMADLRTAAGVSAKDQRCGRPKQAYCRRGHDLAVTRASWGRCRECDRIRHRAKASA